MNEFCRLHVEQIRRSVPGGCHRLLPPNQPVSGYDHSLVALKRRQWHPDGRTVTGHVRVYIWLVFIRALYFIFATDLLLMVRAQKKLPGNLESFLTQLHNQTVVICPSRTRSSLWPVPAHYLVCNWSSLFINFTIIYLAKTHDQV